MSWKGRRDMRQSGWWQAKRRAAALTLPIRCGKCGGWVRATDRWQLGHVIPVARGGMFGPTQVEHASCNERDGRRMAPAYRARTEAPSRRW